MMNKKLLLSALLAFFALTLSFSSCKKESKTDTTETTTEVLRGYDDYIPCPHCGGRLYDISPYLSLLIGSDGQVNTQTVIELGFGHRHEYQYGGNCTITGCTYNGLHHEHLVYYQKLNNGYDHYQDDWIHLGGGGEGGN